MEYRTPLARAARLAVAGALASCWACGGNGADEPGQRVVLGTGEVEFEPMNGEPHLPLVAGAQGGFHAWASFLAYGFEAQRVSMLLTTRVEDDPASSLSMRAELTLRDTVDADGQPARSFAGFPAQVRGARCADGKRVRVHVRLLGEDAASAEDERHYIAELAPAQRSTSCP